MAVSHEELLTALRAILAESPGDFVYEIRSSVLGTGWDGDTWDHPRVVAWSQACQVVARYVSEHPKVGP